MAQVKPVGIEPTIAAQTPWDLKVDTAEINYLRQLYPNLTDEEYQKIVENAARLMASFPDPIGPNKHVTGLALGKVQSGKTLSFTALIGLAANNGYRIIIVLSGTKEKLKIHFYP